jgi:hypothetical protein
MLHSQTVGNLRIYSKFAIITCYICQTDFLCPGNPICYPQCDEWQYDWLSSAQVFAKQWDSHHSWQYVYMLPDTVRLLTSIRSIQKRLVCQSTTPSCISINTPLKIFWWRVQLSTTVRNPMKNAMVPWGKVTFGIRTNMKVVNRYIFIDMFLSNPHSNKILSDNHHRLTVKCVRQHITDLDEYHQEKDINAEDDHEPDIDKKTRWSRCFCAGHILLGLYHGRASFKTVETAHTSQSDAAFTSFHKRLATYLNIVLLAAGSSLPSPQGVKFHPYDIVSFSCIVYGDIFLYGATVHQITKYHLISVDYVSTEDWRLTTDLLCCSPRFFKWPRYDCVVAKTITGPIFAHLVFLFTCEVGSILYPVALVQPVKNGYFY